jgi:bla regulator protein blaR1
MGNEPLLAVLPWSPAVEAIGWTLIDFCWQGLLIAVAYAVLRGALGAARPVARLWTGYVALSALALAPLTTLWLRWPGHENVALSQASGATAAPWSVTLPLLPASSHLDQALPWLVAAWAAGVLLLAVRTAAQWWTLHRICREAQPLDGIWELRLARLQTAFRVPQTVRMLQSARIASPLLLGVLKPVILLPAGLALRLPVAQLELLLGHELAHLRRWDHVVNLAQVMLETALFYHPAVHWVSRRVREDREQCCDDLVASVCNEPIDYARALLAVAEARVTQPRFALGAGGGLLLQRVERIVGAPARPAPGRLLLLGAALGMLLVGHQWARHDLQLLAVDLPMPDLRPQLGALPTPFEGITIADLLQSPRWSPPPPDLSLADTRLAETGSPTSPARDAAPTLPPLPDAITAEAIAAPVLIEVPPPAVSSMRPLPVVAAAVDEGPAYASPRPSRSESPQYPHAAAQAGIEGGVVLSFRIAADGRVVDIEVDAEDHPGVFTAAARNALRRWRFAPGEADGRRHLQPFDFTLNDPYGSADGQELCQRSTGSRICRR